MKNVQLINYAFKGIMSHCNGLSEAIEQDSISEGDFKKQLNDIQQGLSAYRDFLTELKPTNFSVYRELDFTHYRIINDLQTKISDLRKSGERIFS